MSPTSRGLSAVGGVAVGALVLGLSFGTGDEAWARIDFNAALFEDFLGPYWETAKRIAGGDGAPAPGYVYPATLATLLAPLTGLGDAAASWIALVLVVASAIGIACATASLADVRSGQGCALVGLTTALAQPVLHGAYWAQASLFVIALSLVGLALVRSERAVLGASAIGLAAAIKLHPAIFLVPLVVKGSGRTVLVALGSFALFGVLIPASFLGFGGFASFHGTAFDALASLSSEAASGGPGSQGLASIASRHTGLDLAGTAMQVIGIALAAALVMRALRSLSTGDGAVAIALLAAIPWLGLEPVWPHALAWMPLAWALAWRQSSPAPRWLALASFACGSALTLRIVQPPTVYAAHALPAASAALAVAAVLTIRGLGDRRGDGPRPRPE